MGPMSRSSHKYNGYWVIALTHLKSLKSSNGNQKIIRAEICWVGHVFAAHGRCSVRSHLLSGDEMSLPTAGCITTAGVTAAL